MCTCGLTHLDVFRDPYEAHSAPLIHLLAAVSA